MAITEDTEQRIADNRGRMRQDKKVPFLIRDDGMLFPNVPLIGKKQNFRPYHGDVNASLEDRLRYLQGLQSKRRVINTEVVADEEAPFDIAKATKDELIAFAQDQYGSTIDPALHMNKIRSMVANLAGIDPASLFGRPPAKNAGLAPAATEQA